MSPVARAVAQIPPPGIRCTGPASERIGAAKDSSFFESLSPVAPRISLRRLDAIEQALSDTDREVLLFVQRLRLCSGAQLRRVFWPVQTVESEPVARTCRRVLRRLADWRILDPLPGRTAGGRSGGSQSYTWHVGPAGLRLLGRLGFTGKRLAEPTDRLVLHTLGLTETVVGLMEAHRDGGLELVGWDSEPACWRAYIGAGGGRVILKADLFVRIGAGRVHEDRWLVEYDRSTESPVTVAGKLRRHLAYRASGTELREHGVDPRVLWLVPDQRREEVLWHLIGQLDPAERELFAVATHDAAVAFLAREARS